MTSKICWSRSLGSCGAASRAGAKSMAGAKKITASLRRLGMLDDVAGMCAPRRRLGADIIRERWL